jgi:hypothetical protein
MGFNSALKALMAACFGHNGRHQATSQKLKKQVQ